MTWAVEWSIVRAPSSHDYAHDYARRVRSVPCPACGAKIGKPCRSVRWLEWATAHHVDRLDRYQQAKREAAQRTLVVELERRKGEP